MDQKELLIKATMQELMVATHAAYYAGVSKEPFLKKAFLSFAKEEIVHFSALSEIINELGYELDMESLHLTIEKDPVKSLIKFSALEDTIVHYFEDLIPILEEPFKSRIKIQYEQEIDHKKIIDDLLEKVSEVH